MKHLFFSVVFVFQICFLFQTSASAQEGKSLKFTDGAEIKVINNFYQDITSIKTTEKEIDAALVSFGKAVPLSEKILAGLKKQNKKLYNQLRKITTAFDLTQTDEKFYIAAFDSINISDFRSGNPQKVRCKVVLMEINSGEGAVYIPLITSVKKI